MMRRTSVSQGETQAVYERGKEKGGRRDKKQGKIGQSIFTQAFKQSGRETQVGGMQGQTSLMLLG